VIGAYEVELVGPLSTGTLAPLDVVLHPPAEVTGIGPFALQLHLPGGVSRTVSWPGPLDGPATARLLGPMVPGRTEPLPVTVELRVGGDLVGSCVLHVPVRS
jgi:hypothetical protein